MKMNNQPMNMLTSVGKDYDTSRQTSQMNSNNPNTVDGQQRQFALASLFNSLSNLAANSNNNNNSEIDLLNTSQQHHQTSIPIHQQTNLAQQQQTSPPATSFASIQSVMAAAMMQQQLATAVSQQQQQHHLQSQANFLNQDQSCSIFTQARLHDQESSVQLSSQQQQQRINYCTICNKELCNKYFMKTHMLKMHGINLEMEQPGDDNDDDDDDDGADEEGGRDEGSRNEDEAEEDRDDNETKRVDDKGRSIESIGHDDQECSSSNQQWSSNNKMKKFSQTGGKKNSHVISNNSNNSKLNGSPKKASCSNNSSTTSNRPATSVMNGFAGNSMGGVVCDICNKELCSKYFLKVHKQNTHGIMTDYQDVASQFMYPFPATLGAPNPFMAPPALPASLVVSPFATNHQSILAPPTSQPPATEEYSGGGSGINSSIKKSASGAKRLRLSGQATNLQQVNQIMSNNTSSQSSFTGEKSLLAIANSDQLSSSNQQLNESSPLNKSAPNKQFESVYRLILAQQQQQQQQQQQHSQPSMAAAPQAPPMLSMDPISAAAAAAAATNPLGALMCFGALGPAAGPFGPAGMSPAMIVDNILRNQHLFNRNNSGSSADSSGAGFQRGNNAGAGAGKQTDRNNNNESKQSNTKGHSSSSKETSTTSNSRYFSHYTEACPMCDRRFKSIKWLKTHMMNDHKQEIGAYMQMMMQYLYTSKSQQMAAAATMAAFEQQQQHQQQLVQRQQIQPMSLATNKCSFAANPYQQQAPDMTIDQANRFNQKTNNSFQELRYQQQQQKAQDHSNLNLAAANKDGELDEFIIDARCRQESLSPAAVMHNNNSTPSSSIGSQMGCANDGQLIYGLNFELSKLNEGGQTGGFLLAHNDNDSDIAGEEDSRDSDQHHRHQSEVLEASEEANNKVAGSQTKQTQQSQQIVQIKTSSS